MGVNGFSSGDGSDGKGQTQCRLFASLGLFLVVLSVLKFVSGVCAERGTRR